uniref:Uncharacterized protein n=1 Tax=Setaria italica TaxID=4555 RepID=K3ZBF2_SETIT
MKYDRLFVYTNEYSSWREWFLNPDSLSHVTCRSVMFRFPLPSSVSRCFELTLRYVLLWQFLSLTPFMDDEEEISF